MESGRLFALAVTGSLSFFVLSKMIMMQKKIGKEQQDSAGAKFRLGEKQRDEESEWLHVKAEANAIVSDLCYTRGQNH
ncbi:hypothetical protein BLGI_3760 [Brevibacillus laterosporus GI-9]|nr:hypothetical protein BLGI_3760 [Brevibacillus laterosporus GI-9]